MSKLFRELFVAVLIAFEILCLSLTLFVARRLWDKIGALLRFKRLDSEFGASGDRGNILYWRRDKAKIGLYLALYVFYAAVALTSLSLVSLGLLRALRIWR